MQSCAKTVAITVKIYKTKMKVHVKGKDSKYPISKITSGKIDIRRKTL